MSQSHITFSTELKTKIVLELLQGNPNIKDVATKYEATIEDLLIWKQQFLANASQIFETQRLMKALTKRVEKYTKENKKLVSMVEKVENEYGEACRKFQGLSIAYNRRCINTRSHTLELKKQHETIATDYLLIS